MTTAPVDRLLYEADVAERLNKTISAFRWMIQKGDAPRHAKIGGRRMWKESDVETWIQEQFDKAAS